ncbi:MAG: alpha-hydroxy-acid oxidizing protein [Ignavibacteria bacterium]|nr:alpha-hydroxy-acid oxidizing protein [Ignavibacteria bacterium]
MTLININDFESAAREKLTQMAYDYYSSGAHDEITLRDNCDAYKRIFLKYRVLVDVSKRDLSTEVLGHKISMPVMIAPTAFHKMAHTDGEVAVAKAASAADTIMILSTLSNSDVEDVVKATSNPVWFQLYVYKDREVTKDLIRRAENAGCKAIVLTVDAPVLGTRERDVRNKFNLPKGITVKNLTPARKENLPEIEDSGLSAYVQKFLDPSLSWKDIEWLKSITALPVLVKGIACKEDALLSVQHGVNGIVVSNHGGRQLDTCRATIDVLPEIADAVQGKIEILIDGGIRRGTDVLKAVALGAKAVLVGRPVIWGLAVDGENGVSSVLEILRRELDLAMALSGCNSVEKITKELIV